MRIMRTYTTQTAHYAQVEMPDGSRVEFKRLLRDSATMPKDAEWLALATQRASDEIAARQPVYRPLPCALYTQSGQDLNMVTLTQMRAYLAAHAELAQRNTATFLAVPLMLFHAVDGDLVTRQERVPLADLTLQQFYAFLGRAVTQYPALATRPVTDVIEVKIEVMR